MIHQCLNKIKFWYGAIIHNLGLFTLIKNINEFFSVREVTGIWPQKNPIDHPACIWSGPSWNCWNKGTYSQTLCVPFKLTVQVCVKKNSMVNVLLATPPQRICLKLWHRISASQGRVYNGSKSYTLSANSKAPVDAIRPLFPDFHFKNHLPNCLVVLIVQVFIIYFLVLVVVFTQICHSSQQH